LGKAPDHARLAVSVYALFESALWDGVKSDEDFRLKVERMEKNLIKKRKKKYLITFP